LWVSEAVQAECVSAALFVRSRELKLWGPLMVTTVLLMTMSWPSSAVSVSAIVREFVKTAA